MTITIESVPSEGGIVPSDRTTAVAKTSCPCDNVTQELQPASRSFSAEAIARGEGIALTQVDFDRGLTSEQIAWLMTHLNVKAFADTVRLDR